jgi:hypothetical protein
MKFFQRLNVTHNSFSSPVVKQILDATKMKFNTFKFLNPTVNHFNLYKELPGNFLIVVLQHNHAKYNILIILNILKYSFIE